MCISPITFKIIFIRMIILKRRCLLIGAPDTILRGVQKDIDSMYRFLRSTAGGAWEDNEITKIENPPKSDLQQLLQKNVYYDFVFIFFSGHGGTSVVDESGYVNINADEKIRVAEFVNKADKEIVIIDSCRSYTTEVTEKMAKYEKLAEDHLRNYYRQLYDGEINKAEKGFLILYASSLGETANETNEGGIFTQSLIGGALSSITNRAGIYRIYKIFSIKEAFLLAYKIVTGNYKSQHPSIEGSVRRNYWFPFALKLVR